MIGLTATARLLQTAQTAAHATSHRTLRPDRQATMDYREDRLSVTLDADGRIVGLRCG